MVMDMDTNESPTQGISEQKKAVTNRRVPAVTRAVSILRYLANESEPIGIVPLARGVGLIPSTCLHITRVLVNEGLVAVAPQTKKYNLGSGILALASAFSLRNVLARVVGNRLDILTKDHGIVFSVAEINSLREHVVVAVGTSQTGVAVTLTVGTRFPLFAGTSGRCWAAFALDPGKLDSKATKKQVQSISWEDPPTFDAWLEQVNSAKKLGYALDVGNFIRGVTVVGVPVFNELGVLVGCLNAMGIGERLVGDSLEAAIVALKDLSNQVHRDLGHQQRSS